MVIFQGMIFSWCCHLSILSTNYCGEKIALIAKSLQFIIYIYLCIHTHTHTHKIYHIKFKKKLTVDYLEHPDKVNMEFSIKYKV